MRRLLLLLLLALTLLLLPALTLSVGQPSNDTPDNGIISASPLIGTWYSIDHGFHGYAEYYWSFGEDGRFAFYVAGYEPPQGGGSIDGSVSEHFVQGRFRVAGSSVECCDIRADSYFTWGDEWKYFPDRDPGLIAGALLATPLEKPENAGDFSFHYELGGDMILHLVIDHSDFPHINDMNFEYVGTPPTAEPADIESLLEWASQLAGITYLTKGKVNQLRTGATCTFYESEKQSIPYRWRYFISDGSLIGVMSDKVQNTSGLNIMPGGDSANRKIDFTALAPGECVITLRYGEYGETDWDGSFVEEHIYHIIISE